MFCVGSLMSQVLQCTQFCALICRRGLPPLRRARSRTRRPGSSAARARRRARGWCAIGTAGVLQLQVAGLVFLVVGVGEEDRGQPVEGEHAVGLRVGDLLAFGGRLQLRWSAVLCRVHGALPRNSTWSMPNRSEPVHRPFAIQGLKLRVACAVRRRARRRGRLPGRLSASLARPAASAAKRRLRRPACRS
jgi:hypothetical protein